MSFLQPCLTKSESSEYFSGAGEVDGESVSVHCQLETGLVTGEEEVGAEEVIDEKTLTKRDIHTLNEQRRRDIIKV